MKYIEYIITVKDENGNVILESHTFRKRKYHIDVLPQDDTCEICQKRIGDHKEYQLWKCLQFSSLCMEQIAPNLKNIQLIERRKTRSV